MFSNLSNRQRSWLDLAVKVAEDSKCRIKHGSVIVRGNSVLAIATNSFRNHPKYIKDYDHCSFHAEQNAIKRLKGQDLSDCTIYVARVNNLSKERMSRPCDKCWMLIVNSGIRKVVFTIDGD